MVIGNVLVGRVSALPGRVSKEECSWRPRSDFSVDRLVLPLRYTQRPLTVKECGVGGSGSCGRLLKVLLLLVLQVTTLEIYESACFSGKRLNQGGHLSLGVSAESSSPVIVVATMHGEWRRQ